MKKALIVLSLVTLVVNVSSAGEVEADCFERLTKRINHTVIEGMHTILDKAQERANKLPRCIGKSAAEGVDTIRIFVPEREPKAHKLARQVVNSATSFYDGICRKVERLSS